MRALRPYQVEAIDAVMREWASGVRSTMLVLPTGTGKTVTAAEIIGRRRPTGRVLWIAHTTELVQQAAETIAAHTGLRVGVEQADSRAIVSDLWGTADDVIVASRQTLTAKRIARAGMTPDFFATLVIDECHHATARQYRDILAAFPGARVLGLTATPIRADKTALGAVFESCAHAYEIRRAIADGYLTPIRQLSIECAGIDLRDVRVIGGDLSPGQLAAIMEVEETLHAIAKPLVRESGDRPTIAFFPSVDASHEFARILAGYTDQRIEVVSGDSTAEHRRAAIGGFRDGEVRYLINCMVLTEGFDAPRAACIAVARPTKSTALYTQMIGRGLRPSPDTGKSDCLVLDFVGASGKHRLVTPADVLAGEPLDDVMRADVDREIRDGATVEEALERAEKARQARDERQRSAAERLSRSEKLHAHVAYAARQVDPFGREGFVGRAYGREGDDRSWATDALLDRARQTLGKNAPSQLTVGECHRIERDRVHRRMARQCTIPQARILAKNGLDHRISMVDARVAIDALAANRWQVTPGMVERWGRKP